ncbi:glycoside hydrolase domain-containing protein [Niastella vici]|nr:glycoside hydrolase domain-containing protein [Niastella vici]
MKKIVIAAILSLLILPVTAQNIQYGVCPGCWNTDSLGNHRVVLQVEENAKLARAVIPWRRRDNYPGKKRIIVQDAATGLRINNVKIQSLTRETGDIFFEPASGKGTYYVYYMPYKNEGRANYPKGQYLKPDTTASGAWLQTVDDKLPPNVLVSDMQSIDQFNSFYPMEMIATQQETAELVKHNAGRAFLVFPEDRAHPIRMKSDLPFRWIQNGPTTAFKGEAAKGENFTWQLGLYALENLDELKISFSDLTTAAGNRIAAKNISCLNTAGITYDGKPLLINLHINKDQVQALWCLMNVPSSAVPGTYHGKVTVGARNTSPQVIEVSLTVTDQLAKHGGVDEPSKMTRLTWLNSTIAQNNTVIAPYTPLKVKGNTIDLLGRTVQLNTNGLPRQVQTWFTPEMTGYTKAPKNILSEPLQFVVKGNDGQHIAFKSYGVNFSRVEPGTVEWTAISFSSDLRMEVKGSLEFDGFIAYTVRVTALKEVALQELALQIPFNKNAATYMMGLGQKGGNRPADLEWKWDVAKKNQDGAWIGAVNAGIQYSLRDEKYVRPLNTNFYLTKPLLLPSSWGNDGKGGISIHETANGVVANNYSGARTMKKGEVLFYNFNLLITPFHPLNTNFQWRTRFYHRYNNPDSIKATGATVVNIHHATPINPWINYPFIEHEKMKAYINEAHEKGLKVKIYNTVRELSNRAWEIWALKSLGHEVYSPGPGGGFSWLQEHSDTDYIAAWFVPEIKDAAVVNSGMNRWHNYYVEGMNWLVNNVGIDGIYLDDVAFDRITMKRIKRVLTQAGHPGIIDLHSANQYNKYDGFNNSANLYMEHFPYLNRLWFGEYFDYEKNTPDFFLTEVSGIPFGLMGEMLEGGGNPYRGMVYGMTNRMPWTENADPRPIWAEWDAFGMENSEMIGYWSPNCPVTTGTPQVPATVYRKQGAALVAIASWAAADTTVQLVIDWKKLGLDPAKATITAPAIKNFQPARSFLPGEALPVSKGKGWLLLLSQPKK